MINAPLSPAPVRRTRSGTCGTLTRLCVRGVSCRPGSPRLAPFPPPPPRPWALFGGFVGTTRRSDFPRSYISGVRPRPSLSGPTPISGLGNRGISRFSRIETPCMQRFSDRAGSADGSRDDAAGNIAFRSFGQRRHPETLISRLHSPACRYPYPTLRQRPRGRRRMVGATVVRYSFGVGLFHSFLDAGLSRRSRTCARTTPSSVPRRVPIGIGVRRGRQWSRRRSVAGSTGWRRSLPCGRSLRP